jgi:outer membrane protein assembly factor BamB
MEGSEALAAAAAAAAERCEAGEDLFERKDNIVTVRQCDVCETEVSDARLKVCEMCGVLCANCLSYHAKFPALKKHQITEAELYHEDLTTMVCPEHHLELKYFCTLHEVLMCSDCFVGQNHHLDHAKENLVNVRDALNSYMENFDSTCMKELQMHTRDCAAALARNAGQTLSLIAEEKVVLKRVDDFFTHVREKIYQLEESLFLKLKKNFGTNMRLLEQQKMEMCAHKSKFENLYNQYEGVKEIGNNSRALSFLLELKSKVTEVTADRVSMEKKELRYMKAIIDDSALNEMLPKLVLLEESIDGVLEGSSLDASSCIVAGQGLVSTAPGICSEFSIKMFDAKSRPFYEQVSDVQLSFEADFCGEVDYSVIRDEHTRNLYHVSYKLPAFTFGSVAMKIMVQGAIVADRTFEIQNKAMPGSGGKFVRQIDLFDESYQTEPLNMPVATAVDKGLVYIADYQHHRIVVTDRKGKLIRQFGSEGSSNGQLRSPSSVCIHDGLLYVTECGNHRVHVFTLSGHFVRRWGSNGSLEGRFNQPTSLAIFNSLVYVSDSQNHRIQVFTLEGEFVRKLGKSGVSIGEFRFPRQICINNGELLVADQSNSRIQAFKIDGKVKVEDTSAVIPVHHIADVPFPSGLACVGDRIYVSEFKNNCIRVVARETGEQLDRYGTFGTQECQFNGPYSLCLDGNMLLVADYKNNRIQLLA